MQEILFFHFFGKKKQIPYKTISLYVAYTDICKKCNIPYFVLGEIKYSCDWKIKDTNGVQHPIPSYINQEIKDLNKIIEEKSWQIV